MIIAKTGDMVRVHYTGRLTDGTLFDSSEGREPLEFQLGSGMVIEGFDKGITGMSIGSKKTVNIPNLEAYGPVYEENVITIPRNEVPADIPFEVGMTLNMHQDGSGQAIPVIVRAVSEESVTLDANHPLAGQDLIFDIELVAVV
jgi:peptidylprolyl isomerase